MTTILRTSALLAVVLFLAALLGSSTKPIQADHSDGNMSDSVNYWLVTGQLAVCDASNIVTTARLNSALAIWNNGISATKLVNSCTNWGVRVEDVAEGWCPVQPAYACAQIPNAEAPLPLHVYMEPDSQGIDNWTISILGSELGHNLGFNPHLPCPSIMSAAPCNPLVLVLSQTDKDNYYKGYHVDAVSSFAGTSGTNSVNFTWNQSNIHNEKAFLINWRNDCTGQWQIAAAPVENASSFTLPGQQGGLQQYQIVGLSDADPVHGPAGDVSPTITVNVSATLAAPLTMTSSFPSTSVTRFNWAVVANVHHYKVKFDVVPSGMYVPSCVDNITPTQYDWGIPDQHQVQWYTKVVACTSAGLCSAPTTTHALTERYNSGVFNYVFTVSRFGDNINLKFINKSTVWALMLHVRNGDQTTSPWVADSACVAASSAPASMAAMSAFYSFSSGKLATHGHGALSSSSCRPATDHSGDAPAVAWGYIPPQ